MNEQPYKAVHLREYRGILISNLSNGIIKMELKVEDNPILERSTEPIESSIELELFYNMGHSTSFFHNIFSCPKSSQNEECDKCEKVKGMYYKTELNLQHLQIGDTFRIKAALFKDGGSTLPGEIKDFKNYQPLIIAFDEHSLRLADTPEGINKKYEIEQQRLQREREEEERLKEEEESLKEEEERLKEEEERREKREKWERLEQWLAKYPNILKIGVAIIGTTIANQGLRFIGEKIYHLIFKN